MLIDGASVKPVHLVVLAICFLTAMVDGLDNQAIGYSAPAIAADLGIPLSRFGGVFSAGLAGTLVGAILFGRIADKIGRRRTLIFCTAVFGVLTVTNAYARSVTELGLLRFIGGLGLGGAMPCFLTHVAEFAPKARRALATGILWCGYPMGAGVGGLIGSYVLAHQGWRPMFYIGGGLALAVALIQWLFLPESPQFLVAKGAGRERIARVVGRLMPELDLANTNFVAEPSTGRRTAVRELFAGGRGVATVLLWTGLFMTFTLTTSVYLWMPGLFKTAGIPVATAALIFAIANFASLPSQVASGYLLDRLGPFRVLPATYALLAMLLVALAFSLKSVAMVAVIMVAIGFMQGPGIAGLLYLATSIYPSAIRSTGTGFAVGFGRSGQIAASLIVGWMVASGLGAPRIIGSMSLVPLISLISVVGLGMALRSLRVSGVGGEIAQRAV